MNDATNMVVALIGVAYTQRRAIGMLLTASKVLGSNNPDVIGGDNDDDLLTGG
jgi:hypothetical protein